MARRRCLFRFPLHRTIRPWRNSSTSALAFKEGLPFTPRAAQLRAKRKADDNKDNPDALCEPLGLTQLHMHPQPRKIIQTPRDIVILYEANGNVRQILMDGRPLPNNNPAPWWYGPATRTLRLSSRST
jgi:hypothetical protein